MSTHSIPFSIQKKKITLNYHKYAAMGFFQGTQERVRTSRGKRAISVRAIEAFYCTCICFIIKNPVFRNIVSLTKSSVSSLLSLLQA